MQLNDENANHKEEAAIGGKLLIPHPANCINYINCCIEEEMDIGVPI
jgi:hypothetical protein